MIEQTKELIAEAERVGAIKIMTPVDVLRYLIGEVERKDKAIKILMDAMQSINDYSSERATRNESHIAITDANEALKGDETK